MKTETDQKENRRDFLTRTAAVGAVLGTAGLALDAGAQRPPEEEIPGLFFVLEVDDETRERIAKVLLTERIDRIPREIWIGRIPSENRGPYGAFLVV
jgi:hypothetical protein